MSRQVTEFKVAEANYTVTQYPGDRGLEIFWELGRVVGESLGSGMGALFKSGFKPGMTVLDMEIDGDLLGRALGTLFKSTPPKEMSRIVREILEGTLRNGKQINLSFDFAGDYLNLFKVVQRVLEAQFGDFLGALGGLAAGARARAAAVPLAQRTSTGNGPSGGPSLNA